MSEITRVALDAMGGDNAPREMVKGAVEAVQKRKDIKVLLTGKEDVIRKELSAYTYPKEQIEIVNSPAVPCAGFAGAAGFAGSLVAFFEKSGTP